MNQLSDVMFKRMFRVDRNVFDVLLTKISPRFSDRDVTRAMNSSGSPIPVRTRLLVFPLMLRLKLKLVRQRTIVFAKQDSPLLC